MKIEKIYINYNGDYCINCKSIPELQIITNNEILRFCNKCFQELKTLELPLEPVYEYQWLIKTPKDNFFYITKDFFADKNEVYKSWESNNEDISEVIKVDESKRVRKE